MHLRARLLYFLGRIYWRLFQPLAWGVRLLLIQDQSVLLVRHTYQPGWYLPGGGVKRKETFFQAARREAHEEIGASLGEMRFWGVFSSFLHKSDHVVVFLCEDFQLNWKTDYEIAECRFFPLVNLPEEMNKGSENRISEYVQGIQVPTVGYW